MGGAVVIHNERFINRVGVLSYLVHHVIMGMGIRIGHHGDDIVEITVVKVVLICRMCFFCVAGGDCGDLTELDVATSRIDKATVIERAVRGVHEVQRQGARIGGHEGGVIEGHGTFCEAQKDLCRATFRLNVSTAVETDRIISNFHVIFGLDPKI